MNRRAGWGWGAAAGLLVALVLDRWLIQRCSGHLLFHIDGAEYFYLLAMAPFEGRTTLDLLTDPHAREAFGRCCLQVADLALHGSTVPPGIALHTALEWGGLTWSSAALKGLALVYAALTMVLWLALVGGVWRSPGAAWRFAALALLGPAVFVKLNLLHWGTHEQVMLWHAAFLLLVGRGLRAAEGGPRRQGVGLLAGRAALLGVGCATLLLLNTSLLIPGLFTLVWFAAADARRRGGGRGRVALSALALIAIGGGVAGLTWWGITRIELVQSLGFQGVFWRDAKVSEALTLASFHGPWEALRSAGPGRGACCPGWPWPGWWWRGARWAGVRSRDGRWSSSPPTCWPPGWRSPCCQWPTTSTASGGPASSPTSGRSRLRSSPCGVPRGPTGCVAPC